MSSTSLDSQVRGVVGSFRRFENTVAGILALGEYCREHQVELVVMEATGGYERQAFELLWAAGLPVAIVNPRSVRRFAEGMDVPEKTDRIDAAMIGWYAETKQVGPRLPAKPTQQKLAALVTRLGQLTDLRTAQSNQCRLVTDPETRSLFGELLATIQRQIRALETRIAELIGGDPLWSALNTAFREIKGVADRTVARLFADLPEIGTLDGKAAPKLVGLAPLAKDSGKRVGKRSVRGGRAGVRSVLFVVAEIVRRHNPDFRDFHRRLTEAGKPKKVVRIALARKLLVQLNAKARDVRRELAIAS